MATITARVGTSSDDGDLGTLSTPVVQVNVVTAGKQWTVELDTAVPTGVAVGDSYRDDPDGGGPRYKGPWLITSISGDRLTVGLMKITDGDSPQTGEDVGFQRPFSTFKDIHDQIASWESDGLIASTDTLRVEPMNDGTLSEAAFTWSEDLFNNTGNLVIEAPESERHTGQPATGVLHKTTTVSSNICWNWTFSGSGSTDSPLTVEVRGVEFIGPTAGPPATVYLHSISYAQSFVFDRCQVHDIAASTAARAFSLAADADGVEFHNCAIYDVQGTGIYFGGSESGVAVGTLCADCDAGFDSAGSPTAAPLLVLCCSIGHSTTSDAYVDSGGGWHANSEYNATDHTSAAGSNGVTSVAFDTTTFVAVTTDAEDYHIADEDSDLYQAGPSGGGSHAPTYISEDWENDARDSSINWSIGPDEFPSIPAIGSAMHRGIFRGINAMVR